MSIAGQRSLLRVWIDSFEVELEPPAPLGPPRRSSPSEEAGASAGASGSTAPERSAKEGSGLIRCRAIAARHLALALNGAVPVDQRVTRAPSVKIA